MTINRCSGKKLSYVALNEVVFDNRVIQPLIIGAENEPKDVFLRGNCVRFDFDDFFVRLGAGLSARLEFLFAFRES